MPRRSASPVEGWPIRPRASQGNYGALLKIHNSCYSAAKLERGYLFVATHLRLVDKQIKTAEARASVRPLSLTYSESRTYLTRISRARSFRLRITSTFPPLKERNCRRSAATEKLFRLYPRTGPIIRTMKVLGGTGMAGLGRSSRRSSIRIFLHLPPEQNPKVTYLCFKNKYSQFVD